MSKYEEYLNKNKETINESYEIETVEENGRFDAGYDDEPTIYTYLTLNKKDLNKEELKPIVELLNSIEESKNSIEDWSSFISKWKSLEIEQIEHLIAKQYNP